MVILDFAVFHGFVEFILQELIETVKAEESRIGVIIMIQCIANGDVFTALHTLIFFFPKRQDHCLDAFALFGVERIVRADIKRIKSNRIGFAIRKVIAADKVTKTLVGVTDVNQYDMRALFKI